MYKYLIDQSEEHAGMHIDNMLNISAELLHPGTSDAFEEFIFDCKEDEICKIFGFRNDKEVHGLINGAIADKELSNFLFDNKRQGFLLRIHIEIPFSIKFNDEGKPKSWSAGGAYHARWVYADSFHEAMQKAFKLADKCFREDAEKEFQKQKKAS